jgi:aminoglycoside phosphotransferase (APT) family kinase protein
MGQALQHEYELLAANLPARLSGFPLAVHRCTKASVWYGDLFGDCFYWLEYVERHEAMGDGLMA